MPATRSYSAASGCGGCASVLSVSGTGRLGGEIFTA